MSFHNEEQKAACLSSYTGEEALAAVFSPSFAGTNCTPPRAVVGLSLKMMWLSHSLWNVVSFLKVSTPPSVVIWKILRENIRFANVERLLLWLVPLFSFFWGEHGAASSSHALCGPGQPKPRSSAVKSCDRFSWLKERFASCSRIGSAALAGELLRIY